MWPLARDGPTPNYSIWQWLLPAVVHTLNGSGAHANGGLHAFLELRAIFPAFHSGISQWTGRCDFVDVPAKTLLNSKLCVSQQGLFCPRPVTWKFRTPLLKYCQPQALILTLMLSVEIKALVLMNAVNATAGYDHPYSLWLKYNLSSGLGRKTKVSEN